MSLFHDMGRTGRMSATPARASRDPAQAGRWRPTLRAALLAFSLLALLPIGAVMVFGLAVSADSTDELWDAQAAHAIDRLTEGIRRELDPIAASAAFLSRLAAEGKLDPGSPEALRNHLIAALAGLPQVSDLAFIDTDYNVTRANRSRRRIVQTNWAKDARIVAMVGQAAATAGPTWTGFFFAESAGASRLELRTPWFAGDRFVGVLLSIVTIEGLSAFVASVGEEIGGNAFILAGPDEVIALPRSGDPSVRLSDERPLPGLSEIDDPVLPGIWMPHRSSTALHAPPETAHGHVARLGGADHLFLYRALDGYGPRPWTVGLHRPLAEVDAPYRRLWWLEGASIGFVLISAVIVWFASGSIARPLQQLSRRALALRNLEIDGAPVQGSLFREVDQAAGAFNAMALTLTRAGTYLPRNLVQRLIGNDRSLAEGRTRDLTVMFTDIVGFTNRAAALPPAEVVGLLNDLFARQVACIEQNGGTVDKFIGDGLMAFWGAPERRTDHAECALCAALDIQAALRSENAARHARGESSIRLRIGLHSGAALAGTIGAPGRLSYTIVGDTVNVAQRVEEMARGFMADDDDSIILLSSETLDRIGPGLESFSVGRHVVPGHGGEVEVYRLA